MYKRQLFPKVLEDAEIIYVVMPFCGGGDLFGAVEARVTAGLSAMGEPSAFRYASQIAEGLSAMHALGLAHHDVSLENVMLTSTAPGARGGDAVVIDFGMVVKVPLKPTPEARGEQRVPYRAPVMLRPALSWPCKCGKMLYMAPELLEARRPPAVRRARGSGMKLRPALFRCSRTRRSSTS